MAANRTNLVTGEAGFIARAICRALQERGDQVRMLESLIEQVHGVRGVPSGLNGDVEFVRGDVCDAAMVETATRRVDSVIHLAAEAGVGQSMYAIERYTSVNELGTAVLLEQLVAQPVRRIVTASSMSIYGEGRYRDEAGAFFDEVAHDPAALRRAPHVDLDQGRATIACFTNREASAEASPLLALAI